MYHDGFTKMHLFNVTFIGTKNVEDCLHKVFRPNSKLALNTLSLFFHEGVLSHWLQ